MADQASRQNRKRLLISGMLLTGILLYMMVRFYFLCLSLQLESTGSVQQTIDHHGSLLMVMGELLMLSTILCGCTFYNVRKLYFQNERVPTGLLVVSLALLSMACLAIVVKTGRLVYPVNGLPVIADDGLQAAVAEIYGAWHLCNIMLGVFMISWAGSSWRPLWKYSGAVIGLAQILSTYFGQPVKPVPMLMAIALSTAWMLMRGVSSNNGLESECWNG